MTEMLLGQSSPRRLDPWGRRCWRDSVGGGAVAQIGWRRSELSASYLATGVWVRFASRAARGVSTGSLSGWRSAFVDASAGACTTGGTKPGYDLGWEAEAPRPVMGACDGTPCDDLCRRGPSDGPTDLFAAVAVAGQCVAANGGGEVSMS
jgi:hypothetical protein